ncbi:non-ribosomal peptide synthetase [Pseudoalteromonas tunicata]|uniref:Carrier domain-containing protein n=1 Tax=Pseudoalteromonas tunicata D2 TaxID=87626 RepID=A4C384_9GAMM|nr:non-ribosomal peptide synthetase [Pseudoalteromonas tunicata]AXT32871.1 non-ribosomal peptide synthetase [Pseudoalteromonas tunicata]EAR30016.1 hypothetical protein PTD2_00566 [Pseudoalteromonas tunicata D2]
MSVESLFQQLQQAGVIFKAENDKITLKLPKELDGDLKKSLASNKDALRNFLQQLYQRGNKKPRLCRAADGQDSLSFAQQRLWLIDQLQGSSAEYNMPQTYQVRGELDLKLVEQAFTEIIKRHEILRTIYLQSGTQVIQKVQQDVNFSLSRYDLTAVSEHQQAQALDSLMQKDAQTPFDLSNDLMLRVTYVALNKRTTGSPQRGYLLFNMHHIASDGWSMSILSQEFFSLYAALSQGAGELALLPELPIQYRDYAQWQRKWLSADVLNSQLDYWRTQLSDLPVLHSLPLSYHRPKQKQYEGGLLSTSLTSNVAQQLHQLAQQYQLTDFMVLHAALALTLSRFSTNNDIVIGTPIANRSEADLQNVIGFFVNSLVLRVNTKHHSLDDYLSHIRSVHQQAQSNQDVPFEQIVEALNAPRNASYSPLFQIVLTTNSDYGLDTNKELAVELNELTMEPVVCDTPICKFDLELNLSIHNDGIEISWIYDKALFSEQLISRFNNQLNIVLERMAQSAGKATYLALSQVTALHPDEEAHLQSLLQPTPTAFSDNATITELFASCVSATPEKIALICAQQKLSYAELDAASNNLARYLRAQKHLRINKNIGLLLPRSTQMIVAMLAVLKAGCTYVPLNPDYPEARLNYILEDANVELVITTDSLTLLLTKVGISTVILNDELSVKLLAGEDVSQNESEGLEFEPSVVSEPAYVIYTSGSTGQPKGVVVPHRAVIRLVTEPNFMTLNQDTVFLQAANVAFDAATLEIWGPLLNGGQCVIYPERYIELEQLNQIIVRHKVNALWLTAGLFSEWSKECPVELPLQYVLAGGDVLDPAAVCRVQQRLPKVQVINGYGPTENTTFTCCYPVPANFDSSKSVPIGYPLQGDQVMLLSDNELVPYGCVGELCVSGAGLAQGYLNQAELTEQKFALNPFYLDSGSIRYQKLYRTGDLARYNAQGVIEYVGRIDDQIKIRGFRVELGEIEQQISQLNEVSSALVMVCEDKHIKRLVAYVELSSFAQQGVSDRSYDLAQLADELKQRLPDYMVPSAFVIIDAWPLTNNGKIDRRALPQADFSVLQDCYIAPRNQEEQVLVDIWSDLLTIEPKTLSTSANFFALGGHSLLVIQLIAQLKRRGYGVNTQAIFASESLQTMAQLLQFDSHADEVFLVPDNLIPTKCEYINPEMLNLIDLSQEEIDEIIAQVPGGVSNIQDMYPLAPLQQGMLAMHTLTDGRDPYVTTVAFEFSQRPLLDILLNQLNTMIARHDVLRTGVYWRGRNEAVQVVLRNAYVELEWLPVTKNEQVKDLFTNYVEYGAHRIELESAPLMQLQAMDDQGNGRIYVVLKVHHLLIDHVSLDILMEELALIDADAHHQLPDVTPYRHFIARILNNNQSLASSVYFRDMLSSYIQPSYPFGLSEINGDGSQIREYKARLSTDQSKQIRSLTQANNMSPAALFHLAWAMVVAACSGQKDVVFGTVLSGRMQGGPGIERMLGMMINTLPIRVTLGNKSALALLNLVNEALQSLLTYEQASLSEAMRESGLEGNVPLFSAVLNYRHSHDVTTIDEQADLKLLGVKERTNYPFVLSVDDLGLGFTLTLQVNAKIRPHSIMAYTMKALDQLLIALAQNNDASVASWSVVNDAERQQQLVDWNNTALSYPKELCIHELFEAQVQHAPERTAVWFEEQCLSYGELNAKANQLAHYLRAEHGVGPDSLVGLCTERSLEMVIGIWGILKAGGAYVPLDPELPSARLQYLVSDTLANVVLSTQALKEHITLGEAQVVYLDGLGSQVTHPFSEYSEENINLKEIGLTSQHLAYMIYTSGSTGQPKGVLLAHQALHNRIDWMDREYGCDSLDVILQKTPYSFDVSVWEFIWPMLKGAKLVVAKPQGHKDPSYLTELIVATGVTKLHFVPSMLGVMLAHGDLRRCQSLKQVFCSGEALQISHVEQFRHQLPEVGLHNLYGPTEAAIDVSYWDCSQPLGSSVPIGKPIQNIQLYILDDELNLLPQGACGELHIGGDGLARGYLNRPELTQERFIANPFYQAEEGNSSERLYKTGDLVRYKEDGNIEYMGRLDHQVKIRGFRIELGEIEYQVAQHKQIDSALVVAQADKAGNQRLIAYGKTVQADAPKEDVITSLKAELAAVLPEYMVPANVILVSEWPLTPNGKIDRRGLPSVDESIDSTAYVAPHGETEVMLAEVWAHVLKLDVARISRNANFFELGGHSLLVMKLVQSIDQVFKTRGMEINKVAQMPSLAAMATAIETHNAYEWQAVRPILDSSISSSAVIYLAPGAGMTSGGYMDLARAMPQVQFMSLEPVGMNQNDPQIQDWDALLTCYVEAIVCHRQTLHHCPDKIYLMGHSSGGAVAFDTALRLESLGCKVEVLLCECLVATDDEAEFQISNEDKQELMLSYARQLKPEDSDDKLLSWLNLPMTQRLFGMYFRQVDWARCYRPQQQLQGLLTMIVTPELGMEYWENKQMQLAPHVRLPVKMVQAQGKHVTMIKSPYAMNLATMLNRMLSA